MSFPERGSRVADSRVEQVKKEINLEQAQKFVKNLGKIMNPKSMMLLAQAIVAFAAPSKSEAAPIQEPTRVAKNEKQQGVIDIKMNLDLFKSENEAKGSALKMRNETVNAARDAVKRKKEDQISRHSHVKQANHAFGVTRTSDKKRYEAFQENIKDSEREAKTSIENAEHIRDEAIKGAEELYQARLAAIQKKWHKEQFVEEVVIPGKTIEQRMKEGDVDVSDEPTEKPSEQQEESTEESRFNQSHP